MVWETLVACIDTLSDRGNLIQQVASPDISILDVIESFIASSHEAIDGPWVSDFVLLAEVASHWQLSLIGVLVLAKTGEIDNEGHVAAVATEKPHWLEMGLHKGSAFH